MLIYFTAGTRPQAMRIAVNAALVRSVQPRGDHTAIVFDKEHEIVVQERLDDVCSSLNHALSQEGR